MFFIILGSILLVIGSLLHFGKSFISKYLVGLDDFISPKTSKSLIIGGVVIVMLSLYNLLFFYADAATTYTLQYPIGNKTETIIGNGWKWRGFAKIIKVDKRLVVKHLTKEQYAAYEDGTRKEPEETYVVPSNPVSFNDKMSAWLGTTVIIDSNPGSDKFTKVASENKNEENIVFQIILFSIHYHLSLLSFLVCSLHFL